MKNNDIKNQESEISNIIYLSVNSSYSHSSLAYGQLRCLSEKYSPVWNWDIVECSINDNPNEIILKILQKRPVLIVSTVYLFNRNFVLDIISKLSVLSLDIKIVFGGPEFLGNNEDILRQYPQISAVFRGDESSFPQYLNLLSSGRNIYESMKQISGICFITENNDYFDGGTALFQDELDNLPSSYEAGYFSKIKPFTQLETSRGCPLKCIFCTSSLSEKVQYHSLDRVRADLMYIQKAGIKEIRIVDRTFNVPSDRAVKLLKMFSEEFPEMKFHLEFEPSMLTDEIFEQLDKAPNGQFHIETGIQTFYQPSLIAVNRNASAEKAEKGLIKLVSTKGIETHADLIYGLPEQTFDSAFDDLNKLIQIGPDEIQLEVLKILPGTPIETICRNELKYSNNPPYEVLSTNHMKNSGFLQISCD